jgi:hypothetical protein
VKSPPPDEGCIASPAVFESNVLLSIVMSVTPASTAPPLPLAVLFVNVQLWMPIDVLSSPPMAAPLPFVALLFLKVDSVIVIEPGP